MELTREELMAIKPDEDDLYTTYSYADRTTGKRYTNLPMSIDVVNVLKEQQFTDPTPVNQNVFSGYSQDVLDDIINWGVEHHVPGASSFGSISLLEQRYLDAYHFMTQEQSSDLSDDELEMIPDHIEAVTSEFNDVVDNQDEQSETVEDESDEDEYVSSIEAIENELISEEDDSDDDLPFDAILNQATESKSDMSDEQAYPEPESDISENTSNLSSEEVESEVEQSDSTHLSYAEIQDLVGNKSNSDDLPTKEQVEPETEDDVKSEDELYEDLVSQQGAMKMLKSGPPYLKRIDGFGEKLRVGDLTLDHIDLIGDKPYTNEYKDKRIKANPSVLKVKMEQSPYHIFDKQTYPYFNGPKSANLQLKNQIIDLGHMRVNGEISKAFFDDYISRWFFDYVDGNKTRREEYEKCGNYMVALESDYFKDDYDFQLLCRVKHSKTPSIKNFDMNGGSEVSKLENKVNKLTLLLTKTLEIVAEIAGIDAVEMFNSDDLNEVTKIYNAADHNQIAFDNKVRTINRTNTK